MPDPRACRSAKAKKSQGAHVEKPTKAKVGRARKPRKAKVRGPKKPREAKESQRKPRFAVMIALPRRGAGARAAPLRIVEILHEARRAGPALTGIAPAFPGLRAPRNHRGCPEMPVCFRIRANPGICSGGRRACLRMLTNVYVC